MDDASRREFLRETLLASLAAFAVTRPSEAAPAPPAGEPLALTPDDRATLAAIAETLIPAALGMPSASEVGAADYLERLARREPPVRRTLDTMLERVTAAARGAMQFDRLEAGARVELLRGIERAAPQQFKDLWYLVAEAYYVNPRVQRLLGHQLAPTNSVGIRMKPFDEALLDRVKAMPRRYREAPDAR